MAVRQDKTQRNSEAAEALRTWASLPNSAPVSWKPLANMVRVAEAEALRLESRLNQLVNTSDAGLKRVSLSEPLKADLGLNRWLRKEREEAYSDWLAWILEELQKPPGSAADVLEVLGIAEPAIVASSRSGNFQIEREFYIRAVGRLDLLLTLDKSVVVIIEVKKYSAETADTAKQAGYYQWLEKQGFRQHRALLLVPDAAEEKYENFSRLLWADVCIRLRSVLPTLVTRIGPVKSSMFVAFISAVETNLLGLMAPAPDADDVERLSYAGTVEHLEKYLGGGAS